MIVNIMPKAQELSDWVRGFAQETLPVCTNPSEQVVRQAITTHLPQTLVETALDATVVDLLEQVLGISVIVQFGREQVGWIATTNSVEAKALLQRYSSIPYSNARHAIGIDGYWILLVNPEFLDVYGVDELMTSGPYPLEMYEQYPDLLNLEDRQECVLIRL